MRRTVLEIVENIDRHMHPVGPRAAPLRPIPERGLRDLAGERRRRDDRQEEAMANRMAGKRRGGHGISPTR